MRNMGGLRQYMPLTFWLMWIATLAIAGIPPFSGFFSKDEILARARSRAGADACRCYYAVLRAWALVAALLTAFYMTRLMSITFHGPNRTGEEERDHLHEAPVDHDRPAGRARRADAWSAACLNLPALRRRATTGWITGSSR